MQTRPAERPPAAAERPNFSGDWTLNRELSDEPQPTRNADDRRVPDGRRGGGSGGFGGRGGYGRHGGYGGGYGGGRGSNQESADDRARIQEAIADARSPSPSLTISHSGASIAITDARGRTRFFQTTGAKDKHQFDAGTVDSTTSWNGDQLVTQYDFGAGRRLTFTYSLLPTTRQLVVRIRIDGAGQYGARGPTMLKYVYDPQRRR